MRAFLLAATVLTAVQSPAHAAQMQSSTVGGMPYVALFPDGGCSAQALCSILTYLHYLGGASAAPGDVQRYFGTAAFQAAHPRTIVVAPLLDQSADPSGQTVNWGGFDPSVTAGQTSAVNVVKSIAQQYAVDPGRIYVTGGSMGGIGTLGMMADYGPNGRKGQLFAGGLAFDGSLSDAGSASARQALQGVPLTVVHGGADTTVNPGPDRELAKNLAGSPGFSYQEIPGAGHGTWGAGYSDGDLLDTLLSGSSPASARVAAQPRTSLPSPPIQPTRALQAAPKAVGDASLPTLDPSASELAAATATVAPAPPDLRPQGLPDVLLPPGPISTSGSQFVDQQGRPVRLACVGWNQIRRDAKPLQQQVLQMVLHGFNCIRLSWVNAIKERDISQIDEIAELAKQVGLRIVIDNHTNEPGSGTQDNWGAQQKNGLWFDVGPGTDGTDGGGNRGTTSDAKFLSDWIDVAKHYAGNETIIGYDLRNEPLFYEGMSTWGDGGIRDIRAMYERVGNAILAVDSSKLIIVEGPQNYGTGAPQGDLRQVRAYPVRLSSPEKLVYSVHEYPPEVAGGVLASGPEKIKQMNEVWGWLITENIAPVWVGEMGASMDGRQDSEAWGQTLVDYLNGKAPGGLRIPAGGHGVSTNWWVWGYLPGQFPNGTLESDWLHAKPRQAAVYSQLGQRSTSDRNVSTTAYGAAVKKLSVGIVVPQPESDDPIHTQEIPPEPRRKSTQPAHDDGESDPDVAAADAIIRDADTLIRGASSRRGW